MRKKKKRIITKILKMDENNEHGNVMTKPLPYGCIKKQEKSPPLKNLILSLTTFSTKIKLDIYFLLTLNFINSNEKMLLTRYKHRCLKKIN